MNNKDIAKLCSSMLENRLCALEVLDYLESTCPIRFKEFKGKLISKIELGQLLTFKGLFIIIDKEFHEEFKNFEINRRVKSYIKNANS